MIIFSRLDRLVIHSSQERTNTPPRDDDIHRALNVISFRLEFFALPQADVHPPSPSAKYQVRARSDDDLRHGFNLAHRIRHRRPNKYLTNTGTTSEGAGTGTRPGKGRVAVSPSGHLWFAPVQYLNDLPLASWPLPDSF